MPRSLLLAALVTTLGLTAPAEAARVPSRRVPTASENGARPDITVPYTTNGRSTLGVSSGVAPYINGKNGVSTVNDGQQRPVFNLIYYGASLQPSSQFNGAMQRPPNQLRPNR